MQSNEWTAEQRFGAMVLDSRRSLGMSQKDLSEQLSEHGLALDNSAISRVEKGTRALRLSEAIAFAKVLRFSLAEFEDAVPPAEDFGRREKRVHAAMREAQEALFNVASELDGLAFVADAHPEVLETVWPAAPVLNGVDLMAHKAKEWEENFVIQALGYRFESVELRDAVRRVLDSITSSAVDDFVGPEEA
jgi:transcriptional regulator with XRE-family HTH domain